MWAGINTCAGIWLVIISDWDVQSNGDTALLVAVGNGHFDCVSTLISNGAEVNIANYVSNGGSHFTFTIGKDVDA